MKCVNCDQKLNNGMLHKKDPITHQLYKSCPRCSDTNGKEHVFHAYPEEFGQTQARETANNPRGDQSYCINCRTLEKGMESTTFKHGELCRFLEPVER